MDVGVCELQLGISARRPTTCENRGSIDVGALHFNLPCILSSSLQKLQLVHIFTLNTFGIVTAELDVGGFSFLHSEVN
jgi:hypothetical protein